MRQPVLIHRKPWQWDPIESLWVGPVETYWAKWTSLHKEGALEEASCLCNVDTDTLGSPWRRGAPL